MTDKPDPVYGGLMKMMYQDPELHADLRMAIHDALQGYVQAKGSEGIVDVGELAERVTREATSAFYMEMNDHVTASVANLEEGDTFLLDSPNTGKAYLLEVNGFSRNQTRVHPTVLEGDKRMWRTTIAVGNLLVGDQFTLHPSEEEVEAAL